MSAKKSRKTYTCEKNEDPSAEDMDRLYSVLIHGGYAYKNTRSLSFLREFPTLVEKNSLNVGCFGAARTNKGVEVTLSIRSDTKFTMRFTDTGQTIDTSKSVGGGTPITTWAAYAQPQRLSVVCDKRGRVCKDKKINREWQKMVDYLATLHDEYKINCNRKETMAFVKRERHKAVVRYSR